jgi:hypothetical protein
VRKGKNFQKEKQIEKNDKIKKLTWLRTGVQKVEIENGYLTKALDLVGNVGWLDGWLAGWLAGWLDGWMDGWMDGWE